jgi:hypothetical protein
MIEVLVPLPDWSPIIKAKIKKKAIEKFHMTAPLSPNVKMHHMIEHQRKKKLATEIRLAFNRTQVVLPARKILSECQEVNENTKSFWCQINYIHPRMFDEEDNFRMSLKGCIDTIADILTPGLAPGRADADPRILWDLSQRKGDPHEYALFIKMDFIYGIHYQGKNDVS